MASRGFYRQCSQEKGIGESRMGLWKKLSKNVVSAESCLSLNPQGALGHEGHPRAGPYLRGRATLLYLHVSQSQDAGCVGGSIKSQWKSILFLGQLSRAGAAVSHLQPTLPTGLVKGIWAGQQQRPPHVGTGLVFGLRSLPMSDGDTCAA